MPDRISVRRAWWQVHKWVALALVVLLIPLGLSGIVLTWDDAIDHVLEPQRYAVTGGTPLPPAALVAAVGRVLPGTDVTMLRYPDGRGPVVASTVSAPRGGHGASGPRTTIWLDPATARVLDVARGNDSLVAVAHAFHGSLFVPGVGRAFVGLLGVAMFVLAASGLWLWWPQAGPWRRGLRWRRGDRRLDTNLHHLAGFWIALPLAVQAFTGAAIAWPQMVALAGGSDMPRGGGNRGAPPLAHPRLTADEAVTAARDVAATGELRSLGWPSVRDAQWRVSFATRQGAADIEVDDATAVATRARPRGGGFPRAARRWHQGDTLGLPWRLALVPIGLAPTLLGVTGLLMWWRGRGRRRRAAVRARLASA